MEAKDFYRDHVALLYRSFDRFRTNARLSMVPVPFEVKYELYLKKGGTPFQVFRMVASPIPIAALLFCWEQFPEYFRVTKDGKTGYIYSFNGSPLSGTNHWAAVDPVTGETFAGSDSLFRGRCELLNAAVLQYRKSWEDWKRSNAAEDAEAATLEELVAFVKEGGKD